MKFVTEAKSLLTCVMNIFERSPREVIQRYFIHESFFYHVLLPYYHTLVSREAFDALLFYYRHSVDDVMSSHVSQLYEASRLVINFITRPSDHETEISRRKELLSRLSPLQALFQHLKIPRVSSKLSQVLVALLFLRSILIIVIGLSRSPSPNIFWDYKFACDVIWM